MATSNPNIAARIRTNHVHFRTLVASAKKYVIQGNDIQAATLLQDAALFAWEHSTGLFASPELELSLFDIARRQNLPITVAKPITNGKKRILHVMSVAYFAGGHTRLAWRWIKKDVRNHHSVALLQQENVGIPIQLKNAAMTSGGQLFGSETFRGSLLDRARDLHQIAGGFDLVVLHTHPNDVIPLIAFYPGHFNRTVIFMNHASHVFWIGVGISALAVSPLQEGTKVCQARRGVPVGRTAVLPVPLEEPKYTMTRSAARKELGLPDNAIVMVSSGSPYKYNPTNGIDFRDLVADSLSETPDLHLVVAGPGNTAYWQSLESKAAGRVKMLGYVDEDKLTTCYRAADIYLDSAPFGSGTAVVEAATHGLPVLSLASQKWREAGLCFDLDGLPAELFSFLSQSVYRAHLKRLINDPASRENLGKELSRRVSDICIGQSWDDTLSGIYSAAFSLGPPMTLPEWDTPKIELIDEYLEEIAVAKDRIGSEEVGHETNRELCEQGDYIPDLYSDAESLLNEGRKNEARELLEKIISKGCSDWRPYNDLGVICFETGFIDKAIIYLRNAAQLEHVGSIALFNIANALLADGQPAAALDACRVALKKDPRAPHLTGLLRRILQQLPEGWERLILRRIEAQTATLELIVSELAE